MKKGWTIRPIGDVCDLATGGTPSRSKPEYFGGNIKWLVSGDIHQREIFDCEGRITDAGMKNSNAKLLPSNSVLIALNGQGKTRASVALLRTPATCNQSMVCMTPKSSSELLPEFLYANLHGRYEEIRRLTSDDDKDRRGLNMSIVRNIKVPIIPLPEQQRIVGVLDEAFEGLATAKANAEKNLQNARALFESHLQSIFTHGGKGWVSKPLANVCELINGRAYKKEEMLASGKYPLLRVGNFFTNKDWYYSDLELDADKYCDRGDLLYAWSASFGPRIWDGGKVIYHYHIWKVLPNSAVVEQRFLFYLLQWDVDQIKQAHGTGTTMMHVGKASMEARVVPIAPIRDQRQIVETLDALAAETQHLAYIYEEKLTALEALKKSLLHQAFSGEL